VCVREEPAKTGTRNFDSTQAFVGNRGMGDDNLDKSLKGRWRRLVDPKSRANSKRISHLNIFFVLKARTTFF
jgi:hypothetical protein